MLTLKALPGRLILRFPEAGETFGNTTLVETGSKLVIATKKQLRPEIGVIVDIGEALNADQEMIRTRLEELKAQEIPVMVSFGSGVCYWQAPEGDHDDSEWGWLRQYRVFRIEEPAVFLVEEDA